MRKSLLAGVVGTLLVLGALGSAAPARESVLEATVRPFQPTSVELHDYPVQSVGGAPLGKARWRVVTGTGNCCENFIGTTRTGRLLDFGGTHLHFSDDLGETWKEVLPLSVVLNGEGTVVDAPGGDVLGATWLPYDGDRLLAFKYEASSGKWLYVENFIHTPFFDRPWIATIKGPFTVGAVTVPYISILTSNFTNDVHYISLDGLNYFVPSGRASYEQTGERVSKWLDLPADADADWTQPVTELGVGPLAGGGALALGGQWLEVPWTLMESPELRWSGYTFPDSALPDGRLLTDSRGRIHHVSTFPGDGELTYMMSPNGGRGWVGETVTLPGDLVMEDWDFKANAQLNKAVVGIHAHDEARDVDQDLVVELSLDPDVKVERIYLVGHGDLNVSSGLGANLRFDFSTIGILPGGQIVTTFMDSLHREPSLAVLLDAGGTASGDVKPPVIEGLAARPSPFTPDGDGRGDRVRISFRLSEPATVSIVVKKGVRIVARLIDDKPLRRRGAVAWDGTVRGGRPAASGAYRYEVTAVDAAGNERVSGGVVRLRRP